MEPNAPAGSLKSALTSLGARGYDAVMTRILWVTGFGPFTGVDNNPTAAAVGRLQGLKIGGFEVVAEVLPTSYKRASQRVHKAYASLNPAAALHLGVAKNEQQLRVERIAANEQTASIPDIDGVFATGERCSKALQIGARLETTVDTESVARRLRRHALPARASDDAGRYVCNTVYFSALEASMLLDPSTLPVFLHVPAIGNPKAVGGATWQLDDIVLAARVVMVALSDTFTGRVTGPIA